MTAVKQDSINESELTRVSGKELVCVQLRSQLEQERADREEIEGELSELKQKSLPAAATFSDKTVPDGVDLANK